MNIEGIVSEIESQIATLEQARHLLAGHSVPANIKVRTSMALGTTPKKRTMSPEGRARIAAAQKKRWAVLKKAAK
jgi:hypothetical protein